MPKTADTADVESTVEYGEGRLARREGKANSTNPYKHRHGCGLSNQRVFWFIGWYDEKNKHLLGI